MARTKFTVRRFKESSGCSGKVAAMSDLRLFKSWFVMIELLQAIARAAA